MKAQFHDNYGTIIVLFFLNYFKKKSYWGMFLEFYNKILRVFLICGKLGGKLGQNQKIRKFYLLFSFNKFIIIDLRYF